MSNHRPIWCVCCDEYVSARLTNGTEIYPHRRDLAGLPFWRCDTCGNYVGCHHKTKQPTTPLGCIATPEIKDARQKIHRILDPIWRSGRMSRREAYRKVSDAMGQADYHTAEIRTLDEARKVYRIVHELGKLQ